MENQNQNQNNIEEQILSELKKITAPQKRFWLTFRFVEGMFYGLGATVGLAIVVASVGFIIKLFGGVPVVGNWLIELGKFIHQ